jgi:hypothetical protein
MCEMWSYPREAALRQTDRPEPGPDAPGGSMTEARYCAAHRFDPAMLPARHPAAAGTNEAFRLRS